MRKRILSFVTAIGLATVMTTAISAAPAPTKKSKITPQALYLSPKEAVDMIAKAPKKVLFVDVRTPKVVNLTTHASIIDHKVPFKYVHYPHTNKKAKGFASKMNPNFVAEVGAALKAKGLTKKDNIILICRSGDRSGKGATMLYKAGYKNTYTVTTGTEGDKGKTSGKRDQNGWKNDKQPWNYKFNKDLFQYENVFK